MDIIAVFTFLILILMFVYFILARKKQNTFPPGPKGYPVVGNTFDVDPKNLHLTLTKWANQYGGIYQVKLFGSNFLVLNSSDLVRQALMKEPNATLFADRESSFLNGDFTYGRSDIVTGSYSEQWTKRRKLGHKILSAYGEGLTVIEKAVQEQLKISVSYMKKISGKSFDPEIMLNEFLSGIVAILITGRRQDIDSEWVKIIDEYDSYLNQLFSLENRFLLDWIPLIRYIPGQISKLYARSKLSQKKFEAQIRLEKDATDNKGMIHHLYAEMNKIIENGDENTWLTEESIFAILTDMVSAGLVSSKGTLWAALRILLHRQDVQKSLQEEIDYIVGSDRLPVISDKSNMPYTETFILETLRYISNMPLLLPHCVSADTTFAGYDIKKGSTVLLNVWNIHHDSNTFTDPYEFKPERFLAGDGSLLPANSSQRRSFLAFGLGKRSCIGESFARNRIFLFISNIMQQFTFVPEEGSKVAMLDPFEMESTLLRMPKRFKCRAIERLR